MGRCGLGVCYDSCVGVLSSVSETKQDIFTEHFAAWFLSLIFRDGGNVVVRR